MSTRVVIIHGGPVQFRITAHGRRTRLARGSPRAALVHCVGVARGNGAAATTQETLSQHAHGASLAAAPLDATLAATFFSPNQMNITNTSHSHRQNVHDPNQGRRTNDGKRAFSAIGVVICFGSEAVWGGNQGGLIKRAPGSNTPPPDCGFCQKFAPGSNTPLRIADDGKRHFSAIGVVICFGSEAVWGGSPGGVDKTRPRV